MPPWIRTALALCAFPLGWAAREAAGGGVGGVVVLACIAGCAWALPRPRAVRVVVLGIACFVLVHLVAAVTAIYAGLATGALLFAAIGSRLWRDESFSSGPPATRAT